MSFCFYVNQNVYPDFWYVCKFVLTLSHGQNAVECGVSINKHTLVDNLKGATLTSLCSVHDEIIHHGNIRSFPIDNFYLATLLVLDKRMTWNKEGRNL